MNTNINSAIKKIKQRALVLQDRKAIQKRIRFLQRSLVQISFGAEKDRPQLYSSLMKSLHMAQKSLLENKQHSREIQNGQ